MEDESQNRVGVPPGDAPEWVRQEWVGLILPVESNVPPNGAVRGVLGGPVALKDIEGAYKVNTRKAVMILRQKSPTAALWWDAVLNGQPYPPELLAFAKYVCEEVQEEIQEGN